ncbi:unnamed protein product [Dracunculus medinensis]|uniref:Cyclic nucleotide-binding domain-containing protein n=1 Tax=Dracunculus medinensis TaxID=318479 RepID=A0A0N4U239_DRAME|nr:unnamed protein product [Dracunculus medinensis]
MEEDTRKKEPPIINKGAILQHGLYGNLHVPVDAHECAYLICAGSCERFTPLSSDRLKTFNILRKRESTKTDD